MKRLKLVRSIQIDSMDICCAEKCILFSHKKSRYITTYIVTFKELLYVSLNKRQGYSYSDP